MSLSMYQASVPPLLRALNNLRNLLEKAAAHVEARKIDPQALLGFRLYPDMLPLTSQVYIATDVAKGCAARLAGVDVPRYEDTERTFQELRARVDKTIAYLQSFSPEQIDGSEARAIEMQSRRGPVHFTGQDYLQNFVLPNVYFHITTAYAILRHNGVELGKTDYLGQ